MKNNNLCIIFKINKNKNIVNRIYSIFTKEINKFQAPEVSLKAE